MLKIAHCVEFIASAILVLNFWNLEWVIFIVLWVCG